LKKFQELQVLTKNQKSLLHKVKTFQNWLISNHYLQTNIIDIDDGIAVIKIK
jgi:predicted O-methyltransferase YrrM